MHYDDHDVYVVQLSGTKKWLVRNKPTQLLPRLYDARGPVAGAPHTRRACCNFRSQKHCTQSPGLEADESELTFMLSTPGSALYIPRGFAHEARAQGSEQASIHVTFAVEITPVFECAAAAHLALHVACTEPGAGRPRESFAEVCTCGLCPPCLPTMLRSSCGSQIGAVVRFWAPAYSYLRRCLKAFSMLVYASMAPMPDASVRR